MDRYSQMMKEFMKEQHPERYRKLKADGDLDRFLQISSEYARSQKNLLLESGVPADQAEEMVLADLLIMPPE